MVSIPGVYSASSLAIYAQRREMGPPACPIRLSGESMLGAPDPINLIASTVF